MHGFLLAVSLLLAGDDAPFAVEALDVEGTPQRFDAADLDGVGDEDLAVTCAKAGRIALLFNPRL